MISRCVPLCRGAHPTLRYLLPSYGLWATSRSFDDIYLFAISLESLFSCSRTRARLLSQAWPLSSRHYVHSRALPPRRGITSTLWRGLPRLHQALSRYGSIRSRVPDILLKHSCIGRAPMTVTATCPRTAVLQCPPPTPPGISEVGKHTNRPSRSLLPITHRGSVKFMLRRARHPPHCTRALPARHARRRWEWLVSASPIIIFSSPSSTSPSPKSRPTHRQQWSTRRRPT